MLFASYDKEAHREGRSYVLTVRYYAFDVREVFEKVLSLGAAAEILSPRIWRERMRNVLREAAAMYEHNYTITKRCRRMLLEGTANAVPLRGRRWLFRLRQKCCATVMSPRSCSPH